MEEESSEGSWLGRDAYAENKGKVKRKHRKPGSSSPSGMEGKSWPLDFYGEMLGLRLAPSSPLTLQRSEHIPWDVLSHSWAIEKPSAPNHSEQFQSNSLAKSCHLSIVFPSLNFTFCI